MYEPTEDRADITPTPRSMRDCNSNLTLMARTGRIGKTAMEELAAYRFAALQANLFGRYCFASTMP